MSSYGWTEFRERYESGRWEPRTKALIDTLSPGDLFVDVGAWIGPTTLWALERGASVIAFEPDPLAAAEFRRTIGDHPAAARVEFHEAAVALNEMGGWVKPPSGKELGGSETQMAADGFAVKTVRLQTVLAGRAPDLVKIDVEGFETVLAEWPIPWLAEQLIPMQISLHGEYIDRKIFDDYGDLHWPDNPRGDIVALP